jgi:hypothetical protein
MMKRVFFLLAAIVAVFGHDGIAQTQISIQQLPSCAGPAIAMATSNIPVILAIISAQNGPSSFACYALMGVTITPATATTPPSITIPTSTASFVVGEVPGGLVNGTNPTFTLNAAPTGGIPELYKNGLLQKSGLDYSMSGNTITFTARATPQTGDILQANYH